MTPEASFAFARYNRWMNAKVYDAAARLTDEERKRDRGAFFGSIHNVMNHILVADRIWLRQRVKIVPPECEFSPCGARRTVRWPKWMLFDGSSSRLAA